MDELKRDMANLKAHGFNLVKPREHWRFQVQKRHSSGSGKIRLALVVNRCWPGRITKNLENHDYWIDQARHRADFIGFPECSLTGYDPKAPGGLTLTSPALRHIGELARRRRLYISTGFAEMARGQLYNSHALFGPRGLLGVVRKINLTDNEKKIFKSGHEFPVFSVGRRRLGIAICADATYYETIHALALRGAEIIFAPHAGFLRGTPASWRAWRRERWPLYAGDAVCYIAGCNQAGLGLRRDFAGGALVVDWAGRILAQSHARVNREELVIAAVDCAAISAKRRRSPFHKQFRKDVYFKNSWREQTYDTTSRKHIPK